MSSFTTQIGPLRIPIFAAGLQDSHCNLEGKVGKIIASLLQKQRPCLTNCLLSTDGETVTSYYDAKHTTTGAEDRHLIINDSSNS